jgi:two-component system, OmpR family, response regulator
MTGKPTCVMCVDDESDILEVAKLCMETISNFEVHCCASGAELLACVQKIFPSVVLLDVMMPEMDGPATLKLIRQNPALDSIPVIFLTARVQPAEVEQYKRMGVADVIAKPFDPMTLSSQVTAIYERFHENRPTPTAQKNLLRR